MMVSSLNQWSQLKKVELANLGRETFSGGKSFMAVL